MARLLTADPASRRRWFLIWQLPVLVLLSLLVVALAIVAPDLLTTPTTLAGAAAVAAASLAVPHLPLRLLFLVPLVDLVAIAVVRSQDVGSLISISSIALVPILCLAFHFERLGVALAASGAVFLTALPYLRASELPEETQWISLLALPTVSVVLALVAQLGARILADRSAKLRREFARSSEQLEITRALIEVMPAGLSYHAPGGELRLANRRALEYAELAGMDPGRPDLYATSVWRPDRIRRIPFEEQFVVRALAGDEIEDELVWLGEPGAQTAVVVSAHQVRAGGEPLGTVIASLDVTELVESVRVRDQFLATLSHELRTPLVSVIGYLDLIAEELDGGDPELLEMLDTARRGARTLTDRISHLLVAGSQDRLTLDLEQVDLGRLVASAVERQRPVADDRGLRLALDLPTVLTTADSHKIGLVVDNLVSNAVKHTPRDGTITVTLRADDQITLTVADTGPGLARHERERAFDRFYRTDAARRDAAQGLGLGLSISKAVVEAHGGEIAIETRTGAGTTVTVRLPARAG